MNTVIAIDIGASSGRLFNVTLNADRIWMDEVYRFENSGIEVGGRLFWDILHIYREVLNGLQACIQKDATVKSVGIDTWGVDFGFLDRNGELLGNPYHYRDAQGSGMIDKANMQFGERTLFNRTGIQEIWFNTIFQLMGILERKGQSLRIAQTLLMIPDLLGYMLTGAIATEYTSASTTQLYRMKDRCWDQEIIAKLGIRHDIFPKVLDTGSVKGTIYPSLLKNADDQPIPLIATAQHDSASAAFAVPAASQDYLFINSGTWSILGIVIDHPIYTEDVFRLGLSNEGALSAG